MNENRTKILGMLADGKIDVREAEKLMNALPQYDHQTDKQDIKKPLPEFFHILVDSEQKKGTQVKIKVPFRLLKSGVKLTSILPEKARKKAQAALQEKGIPFNLNEIDDSNINELLEALRDLEISVFDSDSNETVRIFCA